MTNCTIFAPQPRARLALADLSNDSEVFAADLHTKKKQELGGNALLFVFAIIICNQMEMLMSRVVEESHT